MGKHIGELFRGMRGIITYRLSPFELKTFGGIISNGVPNTFRRMRESIFYVVPRKLRMCIMVLKYWRDVFFLAFVISYLVFDWGEKAHKQTLKKNPADYENDQ